MSDAGDVATFATGLETLVRDVAALDVARSRPGGVHAWIRKERAAHHDKQRALLDALDARAAGSFTYGSDNSGQAAGAFGRDPASRTGGEPSPG